MRDGVSVVPPYTEMLDYVCRDCGFVQQSDRHMSECPACGSASVHLSAALMERVRRFLSDSMVELPELGFWVAKVPVTQIVWRIVMGGNPSHFRGDDLPVDSVSQEDCLRFLGRANESSEFIRSGLVYRLPTSAEWTAFARRGRRKFGNIAWYWNNSGLTTNRVAMKSPNPLGLYDIFGNVWEWCADAVGKDAVCRGGCWCSDESGCALVEHWPVGTRRSFLGFRLCAEVAK